MTIVAKDATGLVAANLITDFQHRMPSAIAAVVADPAPVADPAAFSPGFRLPELDNATHESYAAATDRGLVPAGREVVVHGSGWYSTAEYAPPHPDDVVEVSTVEDIAAAVLGPQR